MAEFLKSTHAPLEANALRVLVYNLILEKDWHLRTRTRNLLVGSADGSEALRELGVMNRELWQMIVQA